MFQSDLAARRIYTTRSSRSEERIASKRGINKGAHTPKLPPRPFWASEFAKHITEALEGPPIVSPEVMRPDEFCEGTRGGAR